MKCAVLLLVTLCGYVWAVNPIEPLDWEQKFMKHENPTDHLDWEQKFMKRIDDPTLLMKQKDILRLLMHIHLPNAFEDQLNIAQTWSIESNLPLYEKPMLVKEFVGLWEVDDMLKRGEIFSIHNKVHRRQAIALFNTFYFAKTYDTFYKTACWAREHVNERMFVYALTLAVLHRADTKDIVLPPIYEIIPNYFVNTHVMNKAYKYKMEDFAYLERSKVDSVVKNKFEKMSPRWDLLKDRSVPVLPEDLYKHGESELTWSHIPLDVTHWEKVGKNVAEKYDVVIIPSNYTGAILNVDIDQKLSYFLEDIGLNAFYYYLHMDSPFWMEGKKYGIETVNRGNLYYYMHKQLLARYYLERLSNDLGEIELINIWKQVVQKYVPFMIYENGMDFPMRTQKTSWVRDSESLLKTEKIVLLEERILDVVDSGFVILEDGSKVSILTEEGMNILGNLAEGNADSINRRFYQYLHIIMKLLIGNVRNTVSDLHYLPSVLEHYETMVRDPAFWQIYKKVIVLLDQYKKYLPSYTYGDLVFPGVKIESVVIDKLITYFDYFDIELNNGIYTDFRKEKDEVRTLVKARQMRLNHKPYTLRVNVVSDKAVKSVVRVFLGPKYDEKGRVIDIEENRHNFVLLDKFVYEIPVGKSVIERESIKALRTTVDRTSYLTLYKRVMRALEGHDQFVIDTKEIHCGFPQRLLLPKGRRGGMPFQLFVMITPLEKTETQVTTDIINEDSICGIRGERKLLIDNLPLGYPFDRPIDKVVFRTPNMIYKDVMIFHKSLDEVMTNVSH